MTVDCPSAAPADPASGGLLRAAVLVMESGVWIEGGRPLHFRVPVASAVALREAAVICGGVIDASVYDEIKERLRTPGNIAAAHPVYALVAAMKAEVDREEGCDMGRVIRLLGRASEAVIDEIGSRRVFKAMGEESKDEP